MGGVLLALALLGPPSEPGLVVAPRWSGGALEIHLRLEAPLPAPFEAALPSGAVVRVLYPIAVREVRAFWRDRKVWEGTAEALVRFDPLTGRYRCQLLLDEVVVATRETASAQAARRWLTEPPPVRLAVAPTRRPLRVRARAVFTSGARWLVLPATTGTDWVEAAPGDRR